LHKYYLIFDEGVRVDGGTLREEGEGRREERGGTRQEGGGSGNAVLFYL